MSNCACGSNLNFDACCGPVIGGKLAETAEALLRARYTAFAMGNTDFLVETLTHAGRFPLAMVLPTLRQGARAYGVTASHGTVMALTKRKNSAVQISPTSYVPPEFYCPALAGDGACTIHMDKPSRCRTMPFSPQREEQDQAGLRVPKAGWLCDVSSAGPVVYRVKKIIEREDFDRERTQHTDQAAILRAYVDGLIESAPNVAAGLESAARKHSGGYVVLNFTTLLPRLEKMGSASFARKQLPVLKGYAKQTEGIPKLKDYHRYYSDNALGLKKFLKRA